MKETKTVQCIVCDTPAKHEDETYKVRSNVRKFSDEQFTLWRCSQCKGVQSVEHVDLDHYYSYYPISDQKLDFFLKSSFENRLELLKNLGYTKNTSLLDFGCNQGLFIQLLKEEGFKIVEGYDSYSKHYRDKAVLDRKYDYIVSQDVVEHFEDPSEHFEIVTNALNEGGYLVVGTPMADKINLNEPEDYIMELHQPYHRHIFSEKGLLDLGARYGLKAVDVQHRMYTDTRTPFVNTKFSWTYAKSADNMLDVFFEPPRIRNILLSPKLLFYALAGYWFSGKTNMTVCFQKESD